MESNSSLFKEIGQNVTIHSFARVIGQENIRIGSNVVIDDFVFIGRHEQIVIGNYVHIAVHASISGGGSVYVSDFTGISSGARILTGSDDFSGGGGLSGPTIPAEFRAVNRSFVILGAHSLIGANVIILPGIVIGEGVSVGAGSLVTKSLEPWGVYAGIPARRLRERPREKMLKFEAELLSRPDAPTQRFRYSGFP